MQAGSGSGRTAVCVYLYIVKKDVPMCWPKNCACGSTSGSRSEHVRTEQRALWSAVPARGRFYSPSSWRIFDCFVTLDGAVTPVS